MKLKKAVPGHLLLIFGAGAFTLTSILGFSFLLNILLRDIFISQNMAPVQNFWITQILVLVFFISISYYSLLLVAKFIISTRARLQKLFFLSVGFFILSQLLQTLYTIVGAEYVFERFMGSYINYFDVVNASPNLNTYSSLLILLKYLIFGILIYTAYKKFDNPIHNQE